MPRVNKAILNQLWSTHRLPNWSPVAALTDKTKAALTDFNEYFEDEADAAFAAALKRFAKESFYRNTDTGLPLLCAGGKLIPYAEASKMDKNTLVEQVKAALARGDSLADTVRPYQVGGSGSPVEVDGERFAVVLGEAGVQLLPEGSRAYLDYDEVEIASLTDEAVLVYYTFDENRFTFPANMLGLWTKTRN